jgi:adenylosuccinate synthase
MGIFFQKTRNTLGGDQMNKLEDSYSYDIYNNVKDTETIPELNYNSNTKYSISKVENILYPIVENHNVIIVAGAFFGDEGKGKTVDAIANHEKIKIVARVNSGENAGHTVVKNNKEFIFHLAPSGMLVKNKINLIGPECVMDPISFMNSEINQLVEEKIEYKNKLFVGNVHIVTPYHKLMDFLGNPNNSSTLKGISPIHSSKVRKRGLRLDHLFCSDELIKKYLEKDIESYLQMQKCNNWTDKEMLKKCEEINKGHKRIPDHVIDFLKAENKIKYLMDLYKREVVENSKFPNREDTSKILRDALEKGEKVLLEGPQSYWLSNACEKHWRSATSADTSADGIIAAAKFDSRKYKTVVINIHKTPASSRVGLGANPSSYVAQDFFSKNKIDTLEKLGNACVDFESIQKQYFLSIKENGILEPTIYKDETGEYGINIAMAISSSRKHREKGATTLKPRVCGLFDCVAHFEVNQIQGPYLSISAVDRADDYDYVGLTIAYVYFHPENKITESHGKEYKNGDFIKAGDSIPCDEVLYFCYPIIKLIKGWRDNPIAANKLQPNTPLPEGVQKFIANIEYFTGAKIISIGNGPSKENLIYIEKERGE